MSNHMDLLKELKERRSTHDCPNCGRATYCAMDDGKSSSTCWCMAIPPVRPVPGSLDHGRCMCRSCLSEELD